MQRTYWAPSRWLLMLLGVAIALASGCGSSHEKSEIVVYTALDAEFSKPIFADFEKQTGLEVLPKFDTESTKTVGLAQAIMAEAGRPRCDVFWNNEILNTLRLEKKGLLEVYRPPIAEEYPAMYRSDDGTWHGFAARARVLIVNTDLVSDAERPESIYDMTLSKWRDRCGIAKPLFGTTATHVACLFSLLGPKAAEDLLLDMKRNGVQIMAGNKQVAQAVSAGQIAFGLTDTDDAIGEIEHGMHVAIVYPDQSPDQMGTLFIPNTLSIMKGCPHPAAARRLVDYLLEPVIEARLAAGPSAQIPLNPNTEAKVRVETPHTIQAMKVDFNAAANEWDAAARFVRKQFTGGD